jgi:hypothetical protein
LKGPASQSLRPRSFSGEPYLRLAIDLDTEAPSFCRLVFLGSQLKRQVIFATLAVLSREGPEDLASRLRSLVPTEAHTCQSAHEQTARALMVTSRARDIIQAVFGKVPDGFLGVLNRIGDDPLPDPDLYYLLFETFANPRHRARATVLRQRSGSISAKHIEIIRRLDPLLVNDNILKRLHRVSQADDANAALALVRGTVSSATDEALRQSVENLGDKTDLATFFNRWLTKMDCPPACPLIPENDPDIALMTSGEEMSSLGRRLRNCAVTRAVYVAQGAEALIEWRHPPGLVAQCRRLTDGNWVLVEIFAKGNGQVDPATAAAFRCKLETLGIPALSPGDTYPRTSGVLTLLGAWGGIGNNLGFDEGEDDPDELDEIADVGNAA